MLSFPFFLFEGSVLESRGAKNDGVSRFLFVCFLFEEEESGRLFSLPVPVRIVDLPLVVTPGHF